MKAMISTCLSAAGINKVVWIDDFFALPSRDDLANAIQESLSRLKDTGVPKVEIIPFSDIDLGQTKMELQEACDRIMEGMSDEQLAEIAPKLGALTGKENLNITMQPDLSPADFAALKQAFGGGLRTFSLGAWTSAGVTEFSSANDDILFLIDKEFNREPGGIDGTKVLSELVKGTRAFCIMLTHTCTEAEQEQRRVAIADSENLQPHRFCVLSKQQTGEVEIDPKFARAIRSVMTHKFNGEIAYTISKTIQDSAGEIARELTKQSVSDLDQALFETSNEEGVVEYDVLLRIFNIQQRYALNKALQDVVIQNQLRSARKFREMTASLNWPPTQPDMSFFRDWRQREIFLEGTGLNSLHAPLTCGDVFEAKKKRRYLLLAQPCDLMVRNDGKRRAEVGLLVLINEVHPDQGSSPLSGYRYFDIKGVFKGDKKWQIDFQNLFVVDLCVLEFVVFNSDGCAKLGQDHPAPSIVLTAGWARRLKRAKQYIFPQGKAPLIPKLGMGKHVLELEGILQNNSLSYPLQRIGRLETGTATAILAAWATFQTRAALEHDFAQTKLGTVNSAEQTGAPAS